MRLWDVEKQQEIATLPEPATRANWEVRSVSFSPVRDSKILAGACSDGVVRLWNIEDGAQIDAIPGPSDGVRSVSFSPDGKTLAATGHDETDTGLFVSLYLWDTATLTEIDVIRTQEGWQIMSFSPDSRMLAFAGSNSTTVRLWDIAARKEKPEFAMINSGVYSVSFSPDGKTLATGYNNGVRLWDVATRTPIITTRGEFRNHSDLIFSPDGRTLVTFNAGGDRLFWLDVPASGAAADGTRLAADVNGRWRRQHPRPRRRLRRIGADRGERCRYQRRWRGEHSRYGCRCRGAT